VCILAIMKLTANTNKRVRAFIDATLNTLEIDLANVTYLDAYDVIQLGGGNARIKARLEACGCVPTSNRNVAVELSTNSHLDAFLGSL